MSLTIPPAANYQSPLVSIPARPDVPPEGKRYIPCEIDWGSANMGGPNNCVSINMQNNATLNFSQVAALSVDNSLCGADIQFIFPDTQETYTVPAYAPLALFPVFSGQTQFYVSAPNALALDVTRFTILNWCPPPADTPVSQAQLQINPQSVGWANGTTNLLLNTSGTLEELTVFGSFGATSAAYASTILIEDTANNAVLAAAQINGASGDKFTGMLIQLTNLQLRFSGGLKMVVSGTAPNTAGANLAVNALYRKP